MNGEIFKALMIEAQKVFGPVSGWDDTTKADVARWTKRTVDGIRGDAPAPIATQRPLQPAARVIPYQPKNFTEPDEVLVGRWDDVENL
jgi:hypothetical protein